MVMRHIGQPQRVGLGMEATQEGQYCRSRTFGTVEYVICRIGILSVNAPVSSKEWP